MAEENKKPEAQEEVELKTNVAAAEELATPDAIKEPKGYESAAQANPEKFLKEFNWHNYGTQLAGTVNNHTVQFYGPGSMAYSMTGLAKDEANWVTGGGATAQGSASEFNDQLNMADRTFNEGTASTTRPCLTILRGYQ